MKRIVFFNVAKTEIDINLSFATGDTPSKQVHLPDGDWPPVVVNNNASIQGINGFDLRSDCSDQDGSPQIIVWGKKDPNKTPDLAIIGIEILDGQKTENT